MALSLNTLLNVAKAIAEDSKCVSMKVGAVLVVGNRIVSTGINGTAPGHTNCCEKFSERGPDHSEWSEKYEVHAEMNALLYSPVSNMGAMVVVTHAPCWNCIKHLASSGVTQVYYGERYYRVSDEEFDAISSYCKENHIKFEKVQ